MSVDAAMVDLKFAEEWRIFGFIDEEFLLIQHAGFLNPGADPGTEHYRYAALRRLLEARELYSDEEIAKLLILAEIEMNMPGGQTFGAAAYHDLIKQPGLTDAQFEKVAAAHSETRFDAEVERIRCMRALRRNPEDRGWIDMALASPDQVLQRWLVDRNELTDDDLRRLANAGGGRAVRNLANMELNRREAVRKHSVGE